MSIGPIYPRQLFCVEVNYIKYGIKWLRGRFSTGQEPGKVNNIGVWLKLTSEYSDALGALHSPSLWLLGANE